MTTPQDEKYRLRYIRPKGLFAAVAGFDAKNSTTRGEFTMDIPGLLADMEWNHMDQLHRPHIHHTYQDNLRIALGRDFAVSLTRWGRWPFLITVADSRISEGVFYQDLVLAGVIFVHNTISMRQKEEMVALRIEWIIASHRFLKPLHGILDRMFRRLNTRLQKEDSVIRSQRFALRKKGYAFLSDPPDFLNSNRLGFNTIYPVQEMITLDISGLTVKSTTTLIAGNLEFLVRREENEIRIWPAACPHEGAKLSEGILRDDCRIECPWHGLKIRAVKLTAASPVSEAYGFRYTLENNLIRIGKSSQSEIFPDTDGNSSDQKE